MGFFKRVEIIAISTPKNKKKKNKSIYLGGKLKEKKKKNLTPHLNMFSYACF